MWKFSIRISLPSLFIANGAFRYSPHHEVATEVCNAVSDFVERVEAERPLLKQPV